MYRGLWKIPTLASSVMTALGCSVCLMWLGIDGSATVFELFAGATLSLCKQQCGTRGTAAQGLLNWENCYFNFTAYLQHTPSETWLLVQPPLSQLVNNLRRLFLLLAFTASHPLQLNL